MLEKDFDQLIRDQFEDHSSPIPADMWRRIKGEDNKDRKALLFWRWYFLGPAFLVLFLMGGQLFFHHALSTHPVANHPAAQVTSATPTSPNSASAQPLISAQTSSGMPATASRLAANPANPVTPVTPASNRAVHPRAKSIQNENSPAVPSGAESSQNANFPSTLAKTVLPVGSNSPTTSATPPAASPSGSPTPANPAATPAAPSTATATPPLPSTESVPHQPSDRPSPAPTPPATAGTHRPQSLSCPDPSKKFTRSKGWYLEALASPDYPIVHSSLNGSSIKELPLLSYTIGLRVTKIFESGFLMTAGLQYSWINLRQTYDSDSLPLPHHFRNLDLPLLIGYEKGNDLFKVGIRGGMIFNIHSWPGSDPYFSNYLKSNTGISSYIGIELIRQVNDRISIFAEPYYKHQFLNMLKNPFVEKIDVGGIFLGLRFTLKSSD